MSRCVVENPPQASVRQFTETIRGCASARVRAKHRRTIAAELTQRIVALLFDGMTGYEVAKEGRRARSSSLPPPAGSSFPSAC